VLFENPVNNLPEFSSPLSLIVDVQQTAEPQSWSLLLPAPTDADEADTVTLTVSLVGPAADYISFEEPDELVIEDLSAIKAGIYSVDITLDDTKDKVVFKMFIQVSEPEGLLATAALEL